MAWTRKKKSASSGWTKPNKTKPRKKKNEMKLRLKKKKQVMKTGGSGKYISHLPYLKRKGGRAVIRAESFQPVKVTGSTQIDVPYKIGPYQDSVQKAFYKPILGPSRKQYV